MVPIKDKRKNGWIAVLTFISLQLDSTLGNLQSQTCDRTAGQVIIIGFDNATNEEKNEVLFSEAD